ncbi:TraR/DksA family transcriptional regulator [Vibrio splendidus]|nr:TraR/DksA family transcriptional regulator [Vibrio splendidus]MCC4883109.1 TraR/DksA family transcriptional regulator [Vibrio splendidus]
MNITAIRPAILDDKSIKDIKMTSALREYFHQRLLDMHSTITTMHKQAQSEAKTETEKSADPIDDASRVEEQAKQLAFANQEAMRLNTIEFALKSFSEDFGFCLECGDDIPVRRLDFDPSCTRCVSCQQDKDLKDKTGR